MLTEPIVSVIAPDRQTAAVARRALERAGVARSEVSGDAKGAASAAKRLRSAGKDAVVAVLAAGFPEAALEATAAATSRGGFAVCANDLFGGGGEDAARDGWLLGQILSQRGCLPCPDLPTAVEAIRLHLFCRPLEGVRIRRPPEKSAVARRLAESAARLGLLAGEGERGAPLSLEITGAGAVLLRRGKLRLELERPETSLAALALLSSHVRAPEGDAPAPEGYASVIDMIVRPPGRLLSELASKRLVAAFGIPSGPERLSTSPTEAARFAAELGAPFVLKLVRPGTEGKESLGAIRKGLRGASELRRAHYELVRLGESLGPPAPLGVLVASEIAGGARLWIARSKHPDLGLLVVGGPGDRPSAATGFALRAPASAREALAALSRILPGASAAQRSALAAAVSRFSSLVSGLGDRVDRAEIHPLVAPESGPALALDALVGIAG